MRNNKTGPNIWQRVCHGARWVSKDYIYRAGNKLSALREFIDDNSTKYFTTNE